MNETGPNVDVIYTHFPHYREAVFCALASNPDFRFRFYYDTAGIEKSIASSLAELPGASFRTHKLGGLLFQFGVPRHLARSEAAAAILLGNPYIVTNWLGAIIFRLRGRRVFMWTHGWITRKEGRIKSLIRNTFYRLAHGLLVYGERARELGVEQGFSQDTIHVIGNSLDYAAQVAARQRVAEDEIEVLARHRLVRNRYFLCVSRLVASVGLEQAIEALAKLDREIPLVVVGAGPEKKWLELLAQELGVRVVFTGPLYEESELAPLFLNTLAVISPKKVGLLAMHALAYGAPVVTHGDLERQMPEVEAIEEGVTGSFFDFGDVAQLAAIMESYAEGTALTVTRAESAARAIAMIEQRFTPEAQVRRITAAIRK